MQGMEKSLERSGLSSHGKEEPEMHIAMKEVNLKILLWFQICDILEKAKLWKL